MANSEFSARFRNKRDTAANFTKNNPVLLDGEIIAVDTSSGTPRLKVGNGSAVFSALPYLDEPIYNKINLMLPKAGGDMTGFINFNPPQQGYIGLNWKARSGSKFSIVSDYDNLNILVTPNGSTTKNKSLSIDSAGAITFGTPLSMSSGGTGAFTAASARDNLGVTAAIDEIIQIGSTTPTSLNTKIWIDTSTGV